MYLQSQTKKLEVSSTSFLRHKETQQHPQKIPSVIATESQKQAHQV